MLGNAATVLAFVSASLIVYLLLTTFYPVIRSRIEKDYLEADRTLRNIFHTGFDAKAFVVLKYGGALVAFLIGLFLFRSLIFGLFMAAVVFWLPGVLLTARGSTPPRSARRADRRRHDSAVGNDQERDDSGRVDRGDRNQDAAAGSGRIRTDSRSHRGGANHRQRVARRRRAAGKPTLEPDLSVDHRQPGTGRSTRLADGPSFGRNSSDRASGRAHQDRDLRAATLGPHHDLHAALDSGPALCRRAEPGNHAFQHRRRQRHPGRLHLPRHRRLSNHAEITDLDA